MLTTIEKLYPNRLAIPSSINDIPNTGYMVYFLSFNNEPIILGHGKKNRAKVIFDNETQITSGHIKALFVRLYHLYGFGDFKRYMIHCQNKEEAKEIESSLHKEIGGNNRNIPEEIRNQLFDGISKNSVTNLVLEIALKSSFDGLSDLRKWRADGLLNDTIWSEISQKLRLN